MAVFPIAKTGKMKGGIICYFKHHIPVIKKWTDIIVVELETSWIMIRSLTLL